MAVKLSFDESKWRMLLKVQRRWRIELATPPPTRITRTRNRDKFEVDGTVQDVLKGRCGRKISSSDNESAAAVMQVFARSRLDPPDLTLLDFYLRVPL